MVTAITVVCRTLKNMKKKNFYPNTHTDTFIIFEVVKKRRTKRKTQKIVNLKNIYHNARFGTLTAILQKDNEGNVFGLSKIVGRYLFPISDVNFEQTKMCFFLFVVIILLRYKRVQNINFYLHIDNILHLIQSPTKWNVSRDQPFSRR